MIRKTRVFPAHKAFSKYSPKGFTNDLFLTIVSSRLKNYQSYSCYMWFFRKQKTMEVSRARNFHSLMILWRGHHRGRSLIQVNDRDTSFTESLLAHELYDGRWYKPRSEKVPRGSVPVYVGSEGTRFVIPMVYLSMPVFRELMESTADEFGFEQQGGLKIACDEEDFEEILLKCLADHKAKTKTRRKEVRRVSRMEL